MTRLVVELEVTGVDPTLTDPHEIVEELLSAWGYDQAARPGQYAGAQLDLVSGEWADRGPAPLEAELRTAILYEGPSPARHREIMVRHRAEWPTLWAILDRVARA